MPALQFVNHLVQFRTAHNTEDGVQCLHPNCPMGHGLATWADVLAHPAVRVPQSKRPALLALLGTISGLGGGPLAAPFFGGAAGRRLLKACPCLFTQVQVKATARSVVHLCEVTLGAPITGAN